MNLLRLGRTELYASAIALGTVEIGLDYEIPSSAEHTKPSSQAACQFLNQALDLGVNFIDTARVYGDAESIIGSAISHRRDEYILATKIVPLQISELDEPGLRDKVRSSVETSLRLLRVESIDLLMVHSASLALIQNSDRLLEALREMQDAGYVRYLGASVYEDAAAAALNLPALDCLQIAYSALDRSAERFVLPEASLRGIGLVARSVLLKGILTSRHRDLPASLAALKNAAASFERLAEDAGITLPELAFRYVLSADVVALCGTSRIEELRTATEYAQRGPLHGDLIAEIQRVEVVDQTLLNPANWPAL